MVMTPAIEGAAMKLWITTALIALITVSAYPRAAKASMTGSALLSFCEAEEVSARHVCLGYIEGASDSYQAGVSSLAGQLLWCYPEGSTVGQMERVVVKFLKEHPEKLHHLAGELARIIHDVP